MAHTAPSRVHLAGTSNTAAVLPSIPSMVSAPELAALLAERRELVSQMRDNGAILAGAAAAMNKARREDQSALAEALRTNQADPGRLQEEKVQAEQQAAERMRNALAEARRRVDADILTAHARFGPKWKAKAQATLADVRQQALDALVAYQAARQQLADLEGWLAWLADPAARLRPQRLLGVGSAAHPTTWDAAVRSLQRELTETPAPARGLGDGQSNGTTPEPAVAVMAEIDAGVEDDESDGGD